MSANELKHSYIEDNEAASEIDAIPALIRAAAVAAGIKELADLTAIDASLIKLDRNGQVTNAHEVVKDLRQRRPTLFHKHAHEMSQAEYDAARRRIAGSSRPEHLI